MATPKEMDVIRRAYELWQQAGEPPNKDEEFYHQAKKELQEALDKDQPIPQRQPIPLGISTSFICDGTNRLASS
jgi:hypothetical protein